MRFLIGWYFTFLKFKFQYIFLNMLISDKAISNNILLLNNNTYVCISLYIFSVKVTSYTF